MNDKILLLGLAAGALYLLTRNKQAGAVGITPKAALLANLSDQAVTLHNGNVLDFSTGVIYSPDTKTYTDIYTGRVIWRPN